MGLAAAATLGAVACGLSAWGLAAAAGAPDWRTVKVMEGENGNRSLLAVDASSVVLDGSKAHATVALLLNVSVGEGPQARVGLAMKVDYDCPRRAMRVTAATAITEGPVSFQDTGSESKWAVPAAGTPIDQVGLMACAKQPLPEGPGFGSPQALRTAWLAG